MMGLTFQEQMNVHILYCLFDLVEVYIRIRLEYLYVAIRDAKQPKVMTVWSK